MLFYILLHHIATTGVVVGRKRPINSSEASSSGFAKRFALVLDVCFQGDQTALAAALGCSQSLISRIVRGVQAPGLRWLTDSRRLPASIPSGHLRGKAGFHSRSWVCPVASAACQCWTNS